MNERCGIRQSSDETNCFCHFYVIGYRYFSISQTVAIQAQRYFVKIQTGANHNDYVHISTVLFLLQLPYLQL